MSAVDNLLKRKGAAEVETAEIIKDGERITVDRRRALSYVSRGLAEWAEGAEEPETTQQESTETPAPAAPASDAQVARDDAYAERSLKSLSKDELVEVAKHYDLDSDGTMVVLQERINDHLSAAPVAGATAGDVPLSGSDSDGN